MTAILPVAAITTAAIAPVSANPMMAVDQASSPGFANLLLQGLHNMETKVAHADELVKRFAVDDSVPVHQVTHALEEARLSVELAMQVRTRIAEAYRDLMNMQL